MNAENVLMSTPTTLDLVKQAYEQSMADVDAHMERINDNGPRFLWERPALHVTALAAIAQAEALTKIAEALTEIAKHGITVYEANI